MIEFWLQNRHDLSIGAISVPSFKAKRRFNFVLIGLNRSELSAFKTLQNVINA